MHVTAIKTMENCTSDMVSARGRRAPWKALLTALLTRKALLTWKVQQRHLVHGLCLASRKVAWKELESWKEQQKVPPREEQILLEPAKVQWKVQRKLMA